VQLEVVPILSTVYCEYDTYPSAMNRFSSFRDVLRSNQLASGSQRLKPRVCPQGIDFVQLMHVRSVQIKLLSIWDGLNIHPSEQSMAVCPICQFLNQ
jgi:hypothetical protein